ncbi:MAG: energy-coupling factor transporter transmembrane component T [Spirochaetales bacterium]|nr:energy-coupling factor transporter transmembrane component T [Spirochaetales bacterium]
MRGTGFLFEGQGKGCSGLGRISGTAHLISLLAVLISLVSFGKQEVGGLLPFLAYPLVMIIAGKLSPGPIFRVYTAILPLFFCLFLSALIFGGESRIEGYSMKGGLASGVSLLLKGTLTTVSMLCFVSLKGFDGLMVSLKSLKIPDFFVHVLAMMVRYISILAEEALVITRAYRLRAPGRKGVYWRDWGSMGGQWFIRTYRRSERIRCAMDLRGGNGSFTTAGFSEKSGAVGFLWTGFWLLFCLAAVRIF